MPRKYPGFHEEDGFNLISILIGLALISVVVMLSSRAYVSSKQMKQSLKSDENYTQVQDVLVDSLKNFVKTKIAASCADPVAFFGSHPLLRAYSGNAGSTKSQPPPGTNAKAWEDVFNKDLSSADFAGQALNRCPQMDKGTGGRFHFCLNIQRDNKAPKDNILQSPFAFVEVAIQLYDLQNGKTIDCGAFADPSRKSAGASVDYVMMWLAENGMMFELKKKNGSLYVYK